MEARLAISRSLVLLLAASLAACSSAAPAGPSEGPPSAPAAPRGGLPEAPAEVPLEVSAGVPFVRLEIGGRSARLLVDTGASVNAISRRLVDELGLEVQEADVSLLGSDGRERRAEEYVDLPELVLGDAPLRGLQALVLELDAFRGAGLDFDGVLGLPLLWSQPVTFDFPAGLLRLERTPLPAPDAETVLSLRTDDRGGLFLPLGLGDATHWVEVDTGSTGGLVLPERLELPFAGQPVVTGQAMSISGSLPRWTGRLKVDGQLGVHRLARPLVDLGRPRLGMQVLRHFVVTFDLERGAIRLARDGEAPVEMPPLRTPGFGIRRGEDGIWEVGYVLAGTPAAAELASGDRLVEVGGRPGASLTRDAWDRLRQGQQLDLVIERGGARRRVVVPVVTLVP